MDFWQKGDGFLGGYSINFQQQLEDKSYLISNSHGRLGLHQGFSCFSYK